MPVTRRGNVKTRRAKRAPAHDQLQAVVDLAFATLRHRPLLWVLLAVGIAVAGALPVIAAGLQAAASSAAVRSTVDGIPDQDRAVVAFMGQTQTPDEAATLDSSIRAGWTDLGLPSPRHLLMFRPLSVAGASFTLGASDSLTSEIRLSSGRAPTSCTPTACQVVLTVLPGEDPVAQAGFALAAQQLGLVVTGTAELLDTQLIGSGLISSDQPLLIGSSVTSMARLDSLSLFGRTTSWLSSIDGAVVLADGPAQFAQGLAVLTEELNTKFSGLVVHWPSDAVSAAVGRATTAGARFGVLGAGSAVLLLGFCVLTGIGMRRRHQLVTAILLRRGAGSILVTAMPLLQVATTAAVGLLAGAVAGMTAAGLQSAEVAGGPARAAFRAFGSSWPALVWLGVGAVILVAAVVCWPERAGRGTRVGLDVLTALTVGMSVLLLSRGELATGSPTDPLTTSTATFISVSTGLLAARLWPVLPALLRRIGRARLGPAAVTWQIAVLGGRRRPLSPSATAGFVAVALCSVVFAGAYQATLIRSAEQQAAYQVPLDARVGPSRDVAAPLSVLDVDRVSAVDPGIGIHPVISSAVSVFAGTDHAAGLPLTGLDPGTLPRIHDFAAVTGSGQDPAQLEQSLRPGPISRQGAVPSIPAGTGTVAIQVTGMTADVTVGLWVADPQGTEEEIQLAQTSSGVRADIDDASHPLRVVALEIAESASYAMHRTHATGEGDSDLPLLSGDLTFGAVTADGADLTWDWSEWGSDVAVIRSASPPEVTVHYQVNDVRVVVVPAFVERARLAALPVAADPVTAANAVDSTVTITVGGFGGLTVRGHIVAVLPRMPTFGARYLIADSQAVSGLLDRTAPGTAAVNQVWIAAPAAAVPALDDLLSTGPVSTADVGLRDQIERTLRTDPIATRAVTLLTIAGVAALGLALIALALSVRADRENEAGEFLSWELDGLPVRSIRSVLLLRVALITVLGVPAGVVGGFFLTRAVVQLLAVGPAGTATQPPLTPEFGTGFAAASLGIGLIATLIAGAVAVTTTHREPRPAAPEVDLR